ncbi:MAG: nucleotide exchange factor GrpE, partial [Zetaproteobacteria bacterium CG_4_8_14_3_um_filter_59_5]
MKDREDELNAEADMLPEEQCEEAGESELEAAQREVAEIKDKMLRMHAEM